MWSYLGSGSIPSVKHLLSLHSWCFFYVPRCKLHWDAVSYFRLEKAPWGQSSDLLTRQLLAHTVPCVSYKKALPWLCGWIWKKKCASSFGVTQPCDNVHGLVRRAWMNFSPHLPFLHKLFCAGHNLQKQMHAVVCLLHSVWRDECPMERKSRAGRETSGGRAPSGLGLGPPSRWILQPRMRLQDIASALWRRSYRRWDRALRFKGSPEWGAKFW